MKKSALNIVANIFTVICIALIIYVIVCWVDIFAHNLPGVAHNYLPFNFFLLF